MTLQYIQYVSHKRTILEDVLESVTNRNVLRVHGNRTVATLRIERAHENVRLVVYHGRIGLDGPGSHELHGNSAMRSPASIASMIKG